MCCSFLCKFQPVPLSRETMHFGGPYMLLFTGGDLSTHHLSDYSLLRYKLLWFMVLLALLKALFISQPGRYNVYWRKRGRKSILFLPHLRLLKRSSMGPDAPQHTRGLVLKTQRLKSTKVTATFLWVSADLSNFTILNCQKLKPREGGHHMWMGSSGWQIMKGSEKYRKQTIKKTKSPTNVAAIILLPVTLASIGLSALVGCQTTGSNNSSQLLLQPNMAGAAVSMTLRFVQWVGISDATIRVHIPVSSNSATGL